MFSLTLYSFLLGFLFLHSPADHPVWKGTCCVLQHLYAHPFQQQPWFGTDLDVVRCRADILETCWSFHIFHVLSCFCILLSFLVFFVDGIKIVKCLVCTLDSMLVHSYGFLNICLSSSYNIGRKKCVRIMWSLEQPKQAGGVGWLQYFERIGLIFFIACFKMMLSL